MTVTTVNDAPSFTMGADPTVAEDAGAQTVAGWATAISAGPANDEPDARPSSHEQHQRGLFAAGPTISATGTLTYTPAANQQRRRHDHGAAPDNGGTANGGVDASPTQTFAITVTAVNDAPVVPAQSYAAQANMLIASAACWSASPTRTRRQRLHADVHGREPQRHDPRRRHDHQPQRRHGRLSTSTRRRA